MLSSPHVLFSVCFVFVIIIFLMAYSTAARFFLNAAFLLLLPSTESSQ